MTSSESSQTAHTRSRAPLWWLIAAGAGAVVTGVLSLLAGALANRLTGAVSALLLNAVDLSPEAEAAVAGLLPPIGRMCLYAVLAVLVWGTLFYRVERRLTYPAALVFTAAFAGAVELAQVICAGRAARLTDWLLNLAAVGAGLACVAAARFAWTHFPKLVNRETVSYLIFGTLTTIVNIATYGFCSNLLTIGNLLSNTVAWLAGVLFAYAVNKVFVFQSKTPTAKLFLIEFALFFAARLFSFLPDEAGMWLMVDVLAWNKTVSKVIANVIVIILNYFFSKWIIFRKKEKTPAN